jgi:hypothetical protein
LLISEPNLDSRTAALLGTLTIRGFNMPMGGAYLQFSGAKAVYVGENPPVVPILHSVHINVSPPPYAVRPTPRPLTDPMIDNLQNHLNRYREKSLEEVRRLAFDPSGLSLETHAVVNALGSCIVGAPELQSQLVALLRPHDLQRIADRSDSLEALVGGAVLALCHQGKNQIFVKEITVEVNRVQEVRDGNMRFSAERRWGTN